jgi:hypothetical protein
MVASAWLGTANRAVAGTAGCSSGRDGRAEQAGVDPAVELEAEK